MRRFSSWIHVGLYLDIIAVTGWFLINGLFCLVKINSVLNSLYGNKQSYLVWVVFGLLCLTNEWYEELMTSKWADLQLQFSFWAVLVLFLPVGIIYICADQHFKSVFPRMSAYFTSASYINRPVYTLAPTAVLSFPYSLYQTGSGFQIINFQVLFGTSCIQINIHWKFSFHLE